MFFLLVYIVPTLSTFVLSFQFTFYITFISIFLVEICYHSFGAICNSYFWDRLHSLYFLLHQISVYVSTDVSPGHSYSVWRNPIIEYWSLFDLDDSHTFPFQNAFFSHTSKHLRKSVLYQFRIFSSFWVLK